ncbi:hypothetical protein CBS101457_003014 [Exobasidium rhododendri]|nr:hypothetical protein CBS101457_003014 [Exobasidium rhododendri]
MQRWLEEFTSQMKDDDVHGVIPDSPEHDFQFKYHIGDGEENTSRSTDRPHVPICTIARGGNKSRSSAWFSEQNTGQQRSPQHQYSTPHPVLSYEPTLRHASQESNFHTHSLGQDSKLPDGHTVYPDYVSNGSYAEKQCQTKQKNMASSKSSTTRTILGSSRAQPEFQHAPTSADAQISTARLFSGPYSSQHHSYASSSTYHAPWEYELLVDATFPFHSWTDLVYKDLSDHQRHYILDRIHRSRPYKLDSIRQRLSERLSMQLALDFLRGDEKRLETAIDTLFPSSRKKKGVHSTWMDGLSKSDRLLVVQKMAEATEQGADDIRELFLDREISPAEAAKVLASPLEDCKNFADQHTLYVQAGKRKKPWQHGLSYIQQLALLQRLGSTSGMRGKEEVRRLMSHARIPKGYGKTMLRADDAHFKKAVMWILNDCRAPPPAMS